MKALINNKKTILFNLAAVILIIAAALSFTSCGEISVNHTKATLVFEYADKNIRVELSDEESKQLCDIVNGKKTYSDDMLSCGFSDKTSFIIDGKTFCPACDTCCTIKDWNSGKLFDISKAERSTIEKIFRNHGGYFPCV